MVVLGMGSGLKVLIVTGSGGLLHCRQIDPARRRPHDASEPVPDVLAAHQQARPHHAEGDALGDKHRLLLDAGPRLGQVLELFGGEELGPRASRLHSALFDAVRLILRKVNNRITLKA